MNKEKDNLIERLTKLVGELQAAMMDAAALTVQDAIDFIQNSGRMVNVEKVENLTIRKPAPSFVCSEGTHAFPVYLHSYTYAVEHDEVDEYKNSALENELCAKEIDQSIQVFYNVNKWHLKKECIFPALRRFGYERICWVLAYYIQKHEADGRISIENKAWAKTYSFPEKNAFEGNIHISSHVGLVDLFTNLLHRKYKAVFFLIKGIESFGKKYDFDFEEHTKEIFNITKFNRLEELVMSGNTDQIYHYLQTFIDDCSEESLKQAQAAQRAKELLDSLVKKFPMPGTVLKLTSSFGMDYAFCRVINKLPDELKGILEDLLNGKEEDEVFIEDLEEQLKRTNCIIEDIGSSEDQFSPYFPADIEFCWDTMSITDLRKEK